MNGIYILQDLMIQNKMPIFKNFKNELLGNIFIPNYFLKKIYAFIEVMQGYPNKTIALALTPLFGMLLNNLKQKNLCSPEFKAEIIKRPSLPHYKVNVFYFTTQKKFTVDFEPPFLKKKLAIPLIKELEYVDFVYLPKSNELQSLDPLGYSLLHQFNFNKLDRILFLLIKHLIDQQNKSYVIKLKTKISKLISFETQPAKCWNIGYSYRKYLFLLNYWDSLL